MEQKSGINSFTVLVFEADMSLAAMMVEICVGCRCTPPSAESDTCVRSRPSSDGADMDTGDDDARTWVGCVQHSSAQEGKWLSEQVRE